MSQLDRFFVPEVADAIRDEIRLLIDSGQRDLELLTVAQFATEFGLSVKTVRNLCDRKRVEVVHLGGRRYIPRGEGRRLRAGARIPHRHHDDAPLHGER